jgi:hypothetical protein
MSATTLALVSMLAVFDAPPSKAVSLLPTSFEGELEEHWKEEIGTRIGDGFSQGDFELITGDALGPAAAQCREGTCVTEVASKSGSDMVVASSVTVIEKDFEIALQVMDGSDGSILASVEDTCGLCGGSEAAEMAKDLASTLRSKLDAMAKAKPALILSSDPPGVTVLIDGKKSGTTPMQTELDVGEHVVVFQRDGYVTEERTLTAVAGVRDRLTVELTPAETEQKWRKGTWIGGWVSFGAGVAGISAGATLWALHGRPYRTDCQADLDGDCRNLYDTQLSGIVSLAAGGAALITGVALIAVSAPNKRKKKSNKRAHLVPTFGGLAGRF